MFELNPLEVANISVGLFGALQKPAELAGLLNALDSGRPKIIVEIGAGAGGTAWAWSKLSSLEKLIIIDLPNGPWGGNEKLEDSLRYTQQNTNAKVVFVKGNSHNSEASEAVELELDSEKVDVLFIDGDHSYAGVKADFLIYSHLVKEGGLVVFHDICEHPPETKCEVKKFWDELKETCPPEKYVEFISEPTNWGGLAVLKI